MEIHHDDQPPQENIQERGTSSDDQQQQEAATSSVRSYDCTFCKRGFSNAQALGGHMNIHRKNKAKHKKAAKINNQNQHSLNMAKIQASYDSPPAAATKWPDWILPLFVERSPLLIIDKWAASSCPYQKDLLWSSPEEEKLDLELRLGPEPYQDSSKSSTGTEKFF